jgi:hypothetical protein
MKVLLAVLGISGALLLVGCAGATQAPTESPDAQAQILMLEAELALKEAEIARLYEALQAAPQPVSAAQCEARINQMWEDHLEREGEAAEAYESPDPRY